MCVGVGFQEFSSIRGGSKFRVPSQRQTAIDEAYLTMIPLVDWDTHYFLVTEGGAKVREANFFRRMVIRAALYGDRLAAA